MKRSWINNLIVYLFMLLGLAVAGYICYTATTSVPKHEVDTPSRHITDISNMITVLFSS